MTSWMRNPLYRNPSRGKIFGVCAGVAESFGWDTWAVRAITLLFAFLTGFGPALLAYLIAFFILDPKPGKASNQTRNFSGDQVSSNSRFKQRVDEAKSTFSKSKEPCSDLLKKVELTLISTQNRVEKMEAFITSGRYELDREFQKMDNSA